MIAVARRRRFANMSEITLAQFSDRFVALVLDARDLPKKSLDFKILLCSYVLGLEPARPYSEGEQKAGVPAGVRAIKSCARRPRWLLTPERTEVSLPRCPTFSVS